jgi:hypothetical protein
MNMFWNIVVLVGWTHIAVRLAAASLKVEERGWRWFFAACAFWGSAHVIGLVWS